MPIHAQITTLPNPLAPKVLPRCRLFGIIGTWMEEDIIAATIQNALTQGCERVYLVDNDSSDDTVAHACAQGAILARTFRTERYDDTLRLHHMNDVMCEVSEAEPDQHLWWLFLDADEFPHGPWGMTLLDYLRSLDQQFRVVGSRFFNHYPGTAPHYLPTRHPLDFQPLCEEISLPMCTSGHRKHSLLRYDKEAALIKSGAGFHLVYCADPVYEPKQPVFLHHFPFREESITRRRLAMLWAKNQDGDSRADASIDTHILARFRSLDAVYCQDWTKVVNFVSIDPISASLESPPPPSGVTLRPWQEIIEPDHQPVLRWYSMLGAWNYDQLTKFPYGDDVTYEKGISFLDGHGAIEDWGCGFAHAKTFVKISPYIGIDGSSPNADKIVDLRQYTSDTECIFMRHVLEHNADWRNILKNAVASFSKRMVLIIFTPFGAKTRQIATSSGLTSFPVPDILFKKEDLTDSFEHLTYTEESLQTNTQYGTEHIFYIEKSPQSQDAWSWSRIRAMCFPWMRHKKAS